MKFKSILADKKGSIGDLYPSVLALVLGIVVLGVGLILLDELWDQTDSGTEAYVAVNESIVGLGNFADFIPLMVIGIAMAIVLGVVLRAFAFRK